MEARILLIPGDRSSPGRPGNRRGISEVVNYPARAEAASKRETEGGVPGKMGDAYRGIEETARETRSRLAGRFPPRLAVVVVA